MKNKLLLLAFISLGLILVQSCEKDDDDNNNSTSSTNTNSTPAPGTGGGAGTGGGTGSGGIPQNSMKATFDGVTTSFPTVTGTMSTTGSTIIITGLSANTYPQLTISIADSIMKDTFNYPIMPGEPYVLYNTDANTSYYPERGEFILRTIDTTRKLVNGRFNITLKNFNNPNDSIELTDGQFNKFYN